MRNSALVFMALAVLASASAAAQQSKASIASEMQKQLASVERQVVPAAEAMPEARYNFAPTQGEFQGVRTFGSQVKHIAATSYMWCSAISGEAAPEGRAGEDGPASITSKADSVAYLKDAFAFCSNAYASMDETTALQPAKGGNSTRLALAALNNAHCMDHYGQMAVYLRMNGIVPPASRRQRQ